jgi:hypothetical protein
VYGVIGEDNSDANTFRVLIRQLANDSRLRCLCKGFDGCGEMLRKGKAQLRAFANLGCDRFVISYDADGNDPKQRLEEVMQRVVRPSGVARYCAVIPTQELEAWILADLPAVTNVIPSWRPSPIKQPPETINDPKEYLEWLSRSSNQKPRYSHATHNEKVAAFLNLEIVERRCPSFQPLASFVRG